MSSELRRDDPRGDAQGRFSRRNFLRGVALSAGAAAITRDGLLGEPPQPLAADADRVGPEAVDITLNLNGKDVKMHVEPRVTLLNAIRNHLDAGSGAHVDLTGTKRVCDRASCGACTVIVDGRTAYSCSMLAVAAQGKKIVTVEGIAEEGKLHPIQEAFVECDGLMCGFCTPGFVVSSKNLLDQNPFPSEEETRRALNGNICRCGTYHGIFEAVKLASIRTQVKGG